MTIEEVAQRLAAPDEPESTNTKFYMALLNQQLDVFTKWAQARDAFRTLAGDESLSWEQRRLAEILERYNQSRINWYEQYNHLETQLKRENTVLEQKIEAITELETTISTRKEQEDHDSPVAPGR